MPALFREKTNEVYLLLLEPIDWVFKKIAIDKYKKFFNIPLDESIGEFYLNYIENHKLSGTVYTPEKIAKYIVTTTICDEDILNNPFLKVLDPACGCGNLIIPCYKHIYEIYKKNLELINEKHELKLTEDLLPLHIVDNNLFGFDMDEFAIKILLIDLFTETGYFNSSNFMLKDFLLDSPQNKFNIIIGNPPYIGHKNMNKDYSAILKKLYKRILVDKGDMHYCFFHSALNNTLPKGKITFISSRYFIESPSGKSLRNILSEETTIEKIVDFYGLRPFKNMGIDPVIITFKNSEHKNLKVHVIKPVAVSKAEEFLDNLLSGSTENVDEFYIDISQLESDRWILKNKFEFDIIQKIESKCSNKLNEICNSYQGIITGCDSAFIVNSGIVQAEGLEMSIIKPWIKSSYIKEHTVNHRDQFIIYADDIVDTEGFPNILNHISKHKTKLENRRECRNGVREWYELQWGRKSDIFEGEKLIFPYKSDKNNFAIDIGSYFSADIYALTLKEAEHSLYVVLNNLLNSKTYEYYFKSIGKKLGDKAYEYYPNNVMKLMTPDITELNTGLDDELYKIFEFSEKEIKTIENKF